jgi:putative ABC transport system permease protein
LEVAPGDTVRVHAYGATTELTVTGVVPELGLAGFGGAIVAPGTFESLLVEASEEAAPPRSMVLVSLTGGVFDTAAASEEAVPRLRDAVAAFDGVQVEAVKADLLESAEREGESFAELFTTIGSFSVLAGILLLINLFVMLAEERKTELGMLRALGFTRRRLTRTFAIEGALYAVLAAVFGTFVGVGIGWVVARAAGQIFGIADQGITFRLIVEPTSLAIGGLTGLAISLATIWLTSLRIARLNVIRAIRDLPEPRLATVRRRNLILGTVGVLSGAAVSGLGYLEEAAIPLLIGVPVAAFSATPLLRRLLPERFARLVAAAVALVWGIAAFAVLPEILGQADLPVFVAQGVVLTAGAVSLVASLDTVWVRIVDVLSSRGRGLAARLGIAYPLARRFRTSMLLAMFSLVIFTMTFIASMSSIFSAQADGFAADARGGFDVVVDANPANPVTVDQLLERDEVTGAAGLARTFARYETDFTTEPRGWTITGFDTDLLAGGAPALSARDDAYASDEAVYEAVLTDPTLAIVPDSFLQDGPSPDRVRTGDTFHVLDPVSGELYALTAAGIASADWAWNGVLVSRDLTSELFGPQAVATRHYLAVAAGEDPDEVAAELNVALLAHGADASSFTGMVTEGLRQQNAFLYLLQAFLGLGLLVGIAGLGVVMVRAVRERRQEIGMLRAMGFQTGLVRAAFLSEAGVIAVQGTVIGAVLGLITARQVFRSTDVFGDAMADFAIPWVALVVIVVLPLLAALAATAWPAARAAATRPAVALRVTD